MNLTKLMAFLASTIVLHCNISAFSQQIQQDTSGFVYVFETTGMYLPPFIGPHSDCFLYGWSRAIVVPYNRHDEIAEYLVSWEKMLIDSVFDDALVQRYLKELKERGYWLWSSSFPMKSGPFNRTPLQDDTYVKSYPFTYCRVDDRGKAHPINEEIRLRKLYFNWIENR
jgi:hypothetical protein